MLKILIADDHGIVRKGLRQILLDGLSPARVEETDNAEVLVDRACADEWDIVISDLNMPGGGGFRALQRIKEVKPFMPILILSIYPAEQYAMRVIQAGASGYLPKNTVADELIGAVKHVLAGETYHPITQRKEPAAFHENTSRKRPHEFLSGLELLVFSMLAVGKSIADAAIDLCIATSLVSHCRESILTKLNRKDDADLTRYALDNQLI